jgi:hypothetical protein
MMGQRNGTVDVSAETTTPVDWENLTAWTSNLDSGQRDRLADALRHATTAQRYQEIVDTVREVLAREEPERPAVAVVFTTMDWDNGYFLTATGRVLFADGSVDEVEFDDIDEVFTDEIGVVGSSFGLGVDVRTGEVDTDDYADNLYEHLGYVAAIANAVAEALRRQISASARRLARTDPEHRDEATSVRGLRVSVSGTRVVITGVTNPDLQRFVLTALNTARKAVGSRSTMVGPLEQDQLVYWVTA